MGAESVGVRTYTKTAIRGLNAPAQISIYFELYTFHGAYFRLCIVKLIRQMNIIHELSKKHIVQLHALYQAEWWTRGRSLAETTKCVCGSQVCIGITSEHDDLIGFVRVLTDFTFKALIFDLIVMPSERGKGLGNKLLSLVKNHEQLKSVRHFELYCLPEMFSFYEKHGFSTNVGEIKLMRFANS